MVYNVIRSKILILFFYHFKYKYNFKHFLVYLDNLLVCLSRYYILHNLQTFNSYSKK